MKSSKKLLTVLLAAALLAGAYFLGTTRSVPAAYALDASALDSWGLAAALSSAAYVTMYTSGSPPVSAGELVAEFYNSFMRNAK